MTRLPALLSVMLLAAAACSSTDSSETSQATPTSAGADETDEGGQGGEEAGGLDATPLADGWTLTRVGDGIKPVLALDSGGQPTIAWLTEKLTGGFAAYAAASEGWVEDRFVEGYFYGPIGLAFDPEDRPHVVYHDHQDVEFQDALGDLALAVRQDGSWRVEAVTDDGHDGWDSTVAIGPDGVVRAAGIDPQQFGRQDGVEYYELGAGGWEVTAIGSGPVEYEWNVALAVSAGGAVGLTYIDNNAADLVYAELLDGTWTTEVIDAEGDVGRFSSLAFDSSDQPHVSYYDADEGTVRYATRADGSWTVEPVGALGDVEISFTGARRLTGIAVDEAGSPQIVFGDRIVVRRAVRGDGGWQATEVFRAAERPLGQLVSFALGPGDVPHIATYEGTAGDGASAEIVYLTTG